ncbi:hypothetical protein SAMN04515666_11936 [Bosea lupini]|uniref:Helix-turn-helix domain-containing protein n=1 Tax=Bosea lupini TaxID=1036779 RepID=A0A1H8AF28_9HYPH|nr:helix-turn-helix domain-containing protein [Bosea lupini]SEM69340.1 hypothetical protein SAMN04515666_11936 [Bosea lupini]
MSAALLGLALKAKLHSQTRKMVLIKLVDCCQEDGTRIYPSLATIAEDAECSVPTARRVMQTFCRVGLLRKVRDGGAGAKSTNHYEMDVEMLARLRRPELWPALEAAALHDPAPDSDEDDAAGHAPDAGSDQQDKASPGANKGITVEGYHGDSLPNPAEGYHPDDTQPLSRNLSYEREGAGASAAGPASEREPDGKPVPSFDDFLEAYPFARGDNRVKQRAAWEAIAFDQRAAAIDGIGAFIAERKAGGIKGRLSSEVYLQGRNWIGLEAKAAQRKASEATGAPVVVNGWTRDWWLLLFDRIKAGKPPGFWVSQADAGKPLGSNGGELAAAAKRIGDLGAYRCDGPEIDAWRPWLAAKGARIPPFKGEFRVFLPSPMPPGGKRDDGDDEVKF